MPNPEFQVQSKASLATTASLVQLACTGTDFVVVDVSGTWAGTLTFTSSTDAGITFSTQTLSPVPTGALVSTTTANGRWYIPTGGLTNVKVTFTRTSGTAVVNMIGLSGAMYLSQEATHAANAITIPATAGRAVNLRSAEVVFVGTPTTATLTVSDGGVTIYKGQFPLVAGTLAVPFPADLVLPPVSGSQPGGLYGLKGNNMVVTVPDAGTGIVTELNLEVRMSA